MATRGCPPEQAAQVDQLLDTLDDHVRREVVNYFENHTRSSTARFQEVLDYVDRRILEHDRDQLSTQLVHNHLPKLQSRDWLEYDRRTGVVSYDGHEDAARLLAAVTAVFD
ncbi:DUF7344 domain-containing protein [Halorarius litoreus]|uniref:DUF7344 domain-containing protein n=1 Tax=Halorarius litoreus TaxID=2962676 RepID=UPI0020CD5EB6|nr:hypothetical protein [Halorarius litoreus]